ncbi:unnamed protein product, partial [Amoebophrya sp. A120]
EIAARCRLAFGFFSSFSARGSRSATNSRADKVLVSNQFVDVIESAWVVHLSRGGSLSNKFVTTSYVCKRSVSVEQGLGTARDLLVGSADEGVKWSGRVTVGTTVLDIMVPPLQRASCHSLGSSTALRRGLLGFLWLASTSLQEKFGLVTRVGAVSSRTKRQEKSSGGSLRKDSRKDPAAVVDTPSDLEDPVQEKLHAGLLK